MCHPESVNDGRRLAADTADDGQPSAMLQIAPYVNGGEA